MNQEHNQENCSRSNALLNALLKRKVHAELGVGDILDILYVLRVLVWLKWFFCNHKL